MWWEHPLVVGIGAAAVVVAGVGTIWGKGVRPAYRAVVRFVKAVAHFAESIDTLQAIAAEFKPNGGNSLHDHIALITVTQQHMVIDVAELKQGIETARKERARMSLDITEMKRQVEVIITEEIPIITALAHEALDNDYMEGEST